MITPEGGVFLGGRNEIARALLLASADRRAGRKICARLRRKIDVVEVAGEAAILRILQRIRFDPHHPRHCERSEAISNRGHLRAEIASSRAQVGLARLVHECLPISGKPEIGALLAMTPQP